MPNTFDKLVEILGTPEDGAPFLSFLAEFDEKPIFEDHRDSKDYTFPESGFSIMTMKYPPDNRWKAISILLHFLTVPTRTGYIKPCSMELPAQITVKDRRKQIHEKLKNSGLRLLRTNLIRGRETEQGHRTDNWDEYILSPGVILTVVSDSLNGRLCSISIGDET
jgi:hypothetical protein